MNQTQLNHAKQLQDRGYTVFYNGIGDPIFFRNNIKHISYSKSTDHTMKIKKSGDVETLKVIVPMLYVFFQERKTMVKLEFGDTFEMIPLKSLE